MSETVKDSTVLNCTQQLLPSIVRSTSTPDERNQLLDRYPERILQKSKEFITSITNTVQDITDEAAKSVTTAVMEYGQEQLAKLDKVFQENTWA